VINLGFVAVIVVVAPVSAMVEARTNNPSISKASKASGNS
jgi:hypothetical protein